MHFSIPIEEQCSLALMCNNMARLRTFNRNVGEQRIHCIVMTVIAVRHGPSACIQQPETIAVGKKHIPTIASGVETQEALRFEVALYLERFTVDHRNPTVIRETQSRLRRTHLHTFSTSRVV